MDGIYVNDQFYTGHSLGYVTYLLIIRAVCSLYVSAFEVTAQPNENQTTIILDTGTSYGACLSKQPRWCLLIASAAATAPQYYVDAMYKDYPGAVWNDSIGFYTLPCDAKINVSMVFGYGCILFAYLFTCSPSFTARACTP